MRISDWSTDVCSSDLLDRGRRPAVAVPKTDRGFPGGTSAPARRPRPGGGLPRLAAGRSAGMPPARPLLAVGAANPGPGEDRKSVVAGKSVSVRVDPGGRGILTQKKNETQPMKIKENQ